MAWLLLVIAGVLEVAWASLLPATEGFRRPWPTLGFVAALAASMALLAAAVRTLPIGTAYAVWVGIGAVGTAVVGLARSDQPPSIANLAALGGLIAAIVAVKATSPH